MSINSAMLAGVSGLTANSSALAAISDNIANINTVAYKRNQVNFANIVTAQAVTGRYSAGGVQGLTRQYISQQGLIQSANSSTDLAISGDGFFIVTEKGFGLTDADKRVFTRAGSFNVDSDGYLRNDAGFYLQGWPIAADGTINYNPSDLTELNSINVKNLGSAVQATANVTLNANLDKRQTISAAEGTYDPATRSMADWEENSDPATGTQPDFSIEMNIVDTMGGTHKVSFSLLRSAANPNEWHAEIFAIPAADVTGGPSGQIAQGLVMFNQDGTIDLANTTLFGAAGAAPTISLAASGAGGTPRWDDGLGVGAQDIRFDLDKLTQYASASTVRIVNPDGATVGTVVGVQVDEGGIVSAIFDNSQIRQIARIGVATFANPDGLQAVSGNSYRATIDSGEYVIKLPGQGGAGSISPSTLENSTVDMSAEFTGLITTQKAYSACSRIITTADQMLDELISMRR
ncbi:MAG: flagellar hook protein FlgE [Phenylobacterium sp.]|uniref:flagellar hook protein FlgE n=1 Tax=Phenylobacterium sp. TaxID=1871053 RepID=UPI00271F6B45|nr:flagellar hook protein FlgE [Phenylobacterium sp.]MDO8900848.1 flagellar hook protein FlgE [Phenylobacterium sp.]